MKDPDEPRFEIVLDGNEYTVWDKEKKIDLFPTKNGKRNYSPNGCTKETAESIVSALNHMEKTRCDD